MKKENKPTTPTDILYRQDANGNSFRDLHQNYHAPIYEYALNYLNNEAAALNMTNAYFVNIAGRFSDFEHPEELVNRLSSAN